MYQILTNKEEKKEYEIQEQQVSIGRIMVSFTINVFSHVLVSSKKFCYSIKFIPYVLVKKKTNSKSVIH